MFESETEMSSEYMIYNYIQEGKRRRRTSRLGSSHTLSSDDAVGACRTSSTSHSSVRKLWYPPDVYLGGDLAPSLPLRPLPKLVELLVRVDPPVLRYTAPFSFVPSRMPHRSRSQPFVRPFS